MYKSETFLNSDQPIWCKGCSFHDILHALTCMLSYKQIDPSKVNIISGIGCSSRLPLYMNTFGMHTLHGRAIPVAIGARLSRPDIQVIVTAGDGDLFSIGIGHFIHAAQKNFKIVVLCLDNQMFSMTKNQSSPTSSQGHRGTLTPNGKTDLPINPVELALACNATFVARTTTLDQTHMVEIFTKALDHNGFAFVHIAAYCHTFDKTASKYDSTKHYIDINKTLSHDPHEKWNEQIYSILLDNNVVPIGIFRTQERPVFT